MPFESDFQPAPPIRGALRSELIRDKALGQLTHEQLAEKYGRSVRAIHQLPLVRPWLPMRMMS